MYLTRKEVDDLLVAYCEKIGLEYSTLHDEAFAILGKPGNGWLFIWYDGDENLLSPFITRIEEALSQNRTHLDTSHQL